MAGFIGAFGTHLLTQSREREKWILDNKKQEYRELLTALSQAHMSTKAAFTDDPKAYSSIAQLQNDSIRIFSDRIFIKSDLALGKLQQSWRDAMNEYSRHNTTWLLGGPVTPTHKFDNEYNRIKDEIVAAANRAVPKTTWKRLQFWKH